MSIRIGIIGCGGIGTVHCDSLKKLGDRVEFVACCDINEDRAKNYVSRFGFKKYYLDHKVMLANEQLDAVYVTTWNAAHAVCTIDALNAGCNVLCEKPMAMNTCEALAMKAAAEKNNKLLMIGFVRRHGNDASAAIDFVNKGYLGDIYFVKASYLRRAGYPGGWFGNKELSGGGPLIDLGVHVIDLSRYIIGKPKATTVFGATFDKIGARSNLRPGGESAWTSMTTDVKPVFTVEDLCTAMIRFDNGTVLYVEASFNLNIKNGSGNLEFFGSKAGLSLEPFELHTEVNDMLADVQIHGSTSCGDFFYREDLNFIDSIEGKAECLATAEDGVELMRILDAIYESAATGKSVDIIR